MPGLVSLFRKLLRDDAGFVVSSELVLVSVVAVIGIIAGASTLRTAVVFELSDVADAIGSLDHSYSFAGATTSCGTVNGSIFVDQSDLCSDCIEPTVPGTPE
jgi:hypothetical protein